MKNITMNELQQKLGSIQLIDVRESYEYQTGCIPTAQNIPMNELIQNPSKYLTLDEEYYLVCQAGGRSQMTGLVLEAQGFKVNNVMGGTMAYPGVLE